MPSDEGALDGVRGENWAPAPSRVEPPSHFRRLWAHWGRRRTGPDGGRFPPSSVSRSRGRAGPNTASAPFWQTPPRLPFNRPTGASAYPAASPAIGSGSRLCAFTPTHFVHPHRDSASRPCAHPSAYPHSQSERCIQRHRPDREPRWRLSGTSISAMAKASYKVKKMTSQLTVFTATTDRVETHGRQFRGDGGEICCRMSGLSKSSETHKFTLDHLDREFRCCPQTRLPASRSPQSLRCVRPRAAARRGLVPNSGTTSSSELPL